MRDPPLVIGGAFVNGGLYKVLGRVEAFLSDQRKTSGKRLLGSCRAESLQCCILGATERLFFS